MKLKDSYKNFFRTEEGEYFLKMITDIISNNHLQAEEQPELARDYVQRAKGAREVLDHIRSVMGSKGKPM